MRLNKYRFIFEGNRSQTVATPDSDDPISDGAEIAITMQNRVGGSAKIIRSMFFEDGVWVDVPPPKRLPK